MRGRIPLRASVVVALSNGTVVSAERPAVTKFDVTWLPVRVEGWADGRDLRYVGASVAPGPPAASPGVLAAGLGAASSAGAALRSWTGTGRRTTESFYVSDREWRIEWSRGARWAAGHAPSS